MKSYFTKIITLYRATYSGHSPAIWTLVILSFINRLGMMVIPFLSVYLTTVLDFSLEQAGVLTGAFGLGGMGGAYLGGRLTDRIGFRKVIFASLFLSGVLLIVLQRATDFYSFLFLVLITAFFGEAYRPAMSASIASFVAKEEMGRAMSFIRLAINVGMSVAFGLGGFIAATLGYAWLFWLDGTTCILAAVYFWYGSQNWSEQSDAVTESIAAPVEVADVAPYQNKTYLLFLLASFLMGIAFMQWFQSVPVFIKTQWNYDERYIGMMMTLSGILKIAFEMPAVYWVEAKQKVSLVLLVALCLFGLSFVPFLFSPALAYCFLGVLFFTAGEIFYFPFNNAVALNNSPAHRRGAYMAWYWMVWGLCFVLGPTLGFSFIAHFGFSAFWLSLMGLIILSWGLHYYLIHHQGLLISSKQKA